MNKKIVNLEEQNKIMQNDKESKNNILKQKDDIIKDKMQKISELENSNKNSTDSLNNITVELNKTKQEKQDLENQLNTEKNQNLQKQKKIEILSQQLNEINNKYKNNSNNEDNLQKTIIAKDDEIKKLNNQIKLNEIKASETEVKKRNYETLFNKKEKDLINKNNELLNLKINEIEKKYESFNLEEIKKIKKSLMKQIGDNLNKLKAKYNESFKNKEEEYDNRFNELSSLIQNSINNKIEVKNASIANINNDNNNKDQNMITNENVNKIQKMNVIIEEPSNNNNIGYNQNTINNTPQQNNNFYNNNVNNFGNPSGTPNNFVKNNSNINYYNNINQTPQDNTNQNNNLCDIINKNNNQLYSFDCTNSMYLSIYIYEGTEEVRFDLYLKNNGPKPWPSTAKLKIAQSSNFTTDDIALAPQKPEEQRIYNVVIKGLGRYPPGEYKTIFEFYCDGISYGENIVVRIQLKEKNGKKSEIEPYMDKINDFRDTFSLSVKDYPDEKIYEILKENEFNFENAFSSLFN